MSASTHRMFVAVCACSSVHAGRMCLSVSTHRTYVAVRVCLCVSDNTHRPSVCIRLSCPVRPCILILGLYQDVLCVLIRQPTWAKITKTVHGKGQRAESKDQRADMCTDGQPRTSCVC